MAADSLLGTRLGSRLWGTPCCPIFLEQGSLMSKATLSALAVSPHQTREPAELMFSEPTVDIPMARFPLQIVISHLLLVPVKLHTHRQLGPGRCSVDFAMKL